MKASQPSLQIFFFSPSVLTWLTAADAASHVAVEVNSAVASQLCQDFVFANGCVSAFMSWTRWLHSRSQALMLVGARRHRAHTGLIEQNDHSTAERESVDRTITVINCNDWGWKWVFRGLWRGWGPRRPNLEGRRAACRPPPARVIVPMCSAPGRIPWGTAHTGGHLKAYLDVAAIRVRTSTQGSNLFQLLERARGWGSRDEIACVCVCARGAGAYGFIWPRSWLVTWQKHGYHTDTQTHTCALMALLLQYTS